MRSKVAVLISDHISSVTEKMTMLRVQLLSRFCLLYTAISPTWAAFIPHLDASDNDHHHVSVASSYMHFHGPVEGPEFEVKVPHLLDEHDHGHNHLLSQGDDDDHHHHHTYTLDYVAQPKYKFSYGVEDHHTGDFHGQKEVRDGSNVQGEYSVKEPGGTIRVVSYIADKDGFRAFVHTSGKNDHSGATYSPHAVQDYNHHQVHHTEPSDDGNYYSPHEEYSR